MSTKRNILVVSSPGSVVDQLVNFVLLNHGVAIMTVRRADGREVTLSVAVDGQDPAAHTTLNQWSTH